MDEDIVESIKEASNVPFSWRLNDREITGLYREYEKAISNTNGDTTQVRISAIQLILLLRLYVDNFS